ncbi:hypothetical protein Taro_052614 [Colocasia esculenta]|uniref:Leucine-rich repeat-containing N-terminal plant-type domain-containing protein n=1 Tax=Colocasia esculenta TaxID=4460 RepID=A0A843XKR6_COLES|nr:hypothetical protein [Colocasia esculenta]
MGGARSATRRVPPVDAPHHRASLELLLALLLVFSTGRPCHGRGGQDDVSGGKTAGGKCMERERQALLAVRDDVWGVADHDQSVPSWERDGDCCSWKGVACDHRSGHVVKLDLRYPEGETLSTLDSKVNPSLLNLGSLRYLDLSRNSFDRAPLPSFIVENFHWLSHLSHLQYLDMSGLNLSAAHDWLQVISKLPTLSVLRLQDCDLPNPPITLPLGNFTSLSTLDLGINSHLLYYTWPLWLSNSHLGYSTWPLWLSNISRLTTLVLSSKLNCTMPPDAFKNLKHLEVLSLDGYGFRGLIPRSLWRLDKLKTLHLSGHDLDIGSSEDLGHLSSLQELKLYGVVGRFPDSLWNIGNLSRLEHLEVAVYYGIMGGWLPESIGKLAGLKTLWLYGINTSGKVLRNMGDLCNLTELTIEGNKANGAPEVTVLFEGLSECSKGSALEHLDISRNGYGGHLPDQIGKLKNLRYVDLSGNSIVGSIPASIGELESLTHLYLSNNQLSGLVPSSIGKLSNLTSMDISSNRLEGALSEAHFSHLSQLDAVHLSHNAALSLNTSQAWIPPFQLSSFNMSASHVGPEVPKWLKTQKKLRWLDLSSNNKIQDLPVAVQVATGRSGATRGLAGLTRSGVNRGGLCRRVLDATPSAGATSLISRRIAPSDDTAWIILASGTYFSCRGITAWIFLCCIASGTYLSCRKLRRLRTGEEHCWLHRSLAEEQSPQRPATQKSHPKPYARGQTAPCKSPTKRLPRNLHPLETAAPGKRTPRLGGQVPREEHHSPEEEGGAGEDTGESRSPPPKARHGGGAA